jgi:NAD(P)-dependent dehydrogenase (short-subunit alcohol dehydrogenase family)
LRETYDSRFGGAIHCNQRLAAPTCLACRIDDLAALEGEKKRRVGDSVPYGRMGMPEDLAGCAIFLTSSESDYVVSQIYNVDGGQWMS